MKKITVDRSTRGSLVQKVEEVYSSSDPQIDKTPAVIASVELSKLLLEVLYNKNYIKHGGFVNKNVVNLDEYNTIGYEPTGEFIDFGDKKKSFNNEHFENLFKCNCANIKRFNIIGRVLELRAVEIECDVCHTQYWVMQKCISDALEIFYKNVYNNNRLDVETRMVLESQFIDKVQRFPSGGECIIYEKEGMA